MLTVKDTQRSIVQVGFDGSVHKTFRGPKAKERFENELLILRYLERAGCGFVPRLLSADPERLLLVTTGCGSRVDHLDPERCKELFAELETYGVRHDDPDVRNVTYRQQDGRFCLIDFEFATLLPGTEGIQASGDPRPGVTAVSADWSCSTEKGPVRPNNEDSFIGLEIDAREVHHLGREGSSVTSGKDLIFAVSDGMGGAKAGDFASRIAVEKITRMVPPLIRSRSSGIPIGFTAVLENLFVEIHKALQYLGESYEECRGMGSTLSLCWFSGDRMHFAHVGDTRIYRMGARGDLEQLTRDDTHVAWLLRTGAISPAEARIHPARNRLQKALGAGNQFVTPQVGEVECKPGDLFLICSDGVTDVLPDVRIAEILVEKPRKTTRAAHLLAEAMESSAKDNATAVIVAIGQIHT